MKILWKLSLNIVDFHSRTFGYHTDRKERLTSAQEHEIWVVECRWQNSDVTLMSVNHINYVMLMYSKLGHPCGRFNNVSGIPPFEAVYICHVLHRPVSSLPMFISILPMLMSILHNNEQFTVSDEHFTKLMSMQLLMNIFLSI